MHVLATVRNSPSGHAAQVASDGVTRALPVPARSTGRGSSVNGGEFLMLALATCYCNDLFREAARLGIAIDAVEVQAQARFDGVGLAARDVRYAARIDSSAPPEALARLLAETDAVAEIHNTLRAGAAVTLEPPAVQTADVRSPGAP